MKEEILKLREKMKEAGIDYYIVPTSDSHNSEYVGEHDRIRCRLTGFTGSNGTLVVSSSDARLWTDGRYFIQCENELAGSEIKMMKMGEVGEPTIPNFIASDLKDDICVGFNGCVMTTRQIRDLKEKCKSKNLKLSFDKDLAGEVWDEYGDRPARSCERVKILDMSVAGVSALDKIEQVRDIMEQNDCRQFVLSKLDDIMWLFNIRGTDVECNPVALSYAFISMDEAFLFLQKDAVSEAVRAYLSSQRVILCEYDDIYDFVSEYPYEGKTLLDTGEINYRIYKNVVAGCEDIKDTNNPTTELKAVKNKTELENMRKYFLRDSVATTKYIYWLKHHDGNITELDAAKKCDKLRLNTEGCLGLSFPTIAAYGSNAAMMHYEATEDSYSVCEKKGMILTDCGGQYKGATTDVTRTVALGPTSVEEKRDYTLVLKGWLNLMNAQWLSGCTGRNLDILARGPVWRYGMDYKCGTGHGVGCYLNVHEGPQSIRWRQVHGIDEAILKPGMTITDEPGVYKEGRYGIRIENTLVVEERMTTSDGTFLGFENLTWVPIDTDLIDVSLFDGMEVKWLRDYQHKTIEMLEPYLESDEFDWLVSEII